MSTATNTSLQHSALYYGRQTIKAGFSVKDGRNYRAKLPCYYANDNKAVRDTPKLSKSRSAVLNLSVQQASFSSEVAVLILCNHEGFHTQGGLGGVVAQACVFGSSFRVRVCMWGVAINW